MIIIIVIIVLYMIGKSIQARNGLIESAAATPLLSGSAPHRGFLGPIPGFLGPHPGFLGPLPAAKDRQCNWPGSTEAYPMSPVRKRKGGFRATWGVIPT